MKTIAITLIAAAALVAGASAAAQTHNGMDKPNVSLPDSISFPLLVVEDERSRIYINEIGKIDFVVGDELLYLDNESPFDALARERVESVEVAGADDIFLGYTG